MLAWRSIIYSISIYKVVISVCLLVCLSDHYSRTSNLPQILIGELGRAMESWQKGWTKLSDIFYKVFLKIHGQCRALQPIIDTWIKLTIDVILSHFFRRFSIFLKEKQGYLHVGNPRPDTGLNVEIEHESYLKPNST